MRNHNFKRIAILLFTVFWLSGCSVLKSVVAPLTPVKTVLPQEKSKVKARFSCKGELKLHESGNVAYCSKGFKSYEDRLNEIERKLNWKEKLAQIITRSSGYLIIGSVLVLIFAPGLFGVLFGRFVEAGMGIGSKGLKAVVSGINKGKKYVRNNGTKFSSEEQKVYNQGADDLLKHIAESTNDPKIKAQINKYRSEIL